MCLPVLGKIASPLSAIGLVGKMLGKKKDKSQTANAPTPVTQTPGTIGPSPSYGGGY